ncbi:MAG: manganese efflux pump MntP family protein [Campylobacter sp.]|uniref:manganese efflux pump MntP n=1 Tax=Campylobacter sp. TaxID=205 RepID=UPI003608C907
MELLLLSIALAMDAAALSIANGAKYRNLALSKILFIAFVFGFFQAAMPLAGYFLGAAFARFIAQIDHFIAFAILGFLGIKMIREACRNEPAQAVSLDTKILISGGFATSIDALAVGVTLSFTAADIWFSAAVIGVVCFALSVAAFYVGKFAGEFLEQKALILGGAILIALGFKILITHLLDHGFLS